MHSVSLYLVLFFTHVNGASVRGDRSRIGSVSLGTMEAKSDVAKPISLSDVRHGGHERHADGVATNAHALRASGNLIGNVSLRTDTVEKQSERQEERNGKQNHMNQKDNAHVKSMADSDRTSNLDVYRAGYQKFEPSLEESPTDATIKGNEQYLSLLRLVLYGYANFPQGKPTAPKPPDLGPNAILGFGAGGQLEMLDVLMKSVVADGIPGDFLEAGTYRGGVAIYMAGFISVNDPSRRVWALDSFKGMPSIEHRVSSTYASKANAELNWLKPGALSASLQVCQRNFAMLNLDKYAHIVPGWFNETMPTLPVQKIAILRLDSDIYVSLMETLEYLYPRLSIGGYVVFDDYKFPTAKAAVKDFRARYGITSEMRWCNQDSKPPMVKCIAKDEFLYWRKS